MIKSNRYLSLIFILSTAVLLNPAWALAQERNTPRTYNQHTKGRTSLPNGWSLSPAGASLPLGDLPLNLVVSHDKTLLAVTNNGQSKQSIQLISLKTRRLLDQTDISRAWYGLKFSNDDHFLYASGGNDNLIRIYSIKNGRLLAGDSIVLGKHWPASRICPVGIELDAKEALLYTVSKEDSAIYVVDLKTKKISSRHALGSEAFSCVMRPGTADLYISLWGKDSIKVFDTRTNSFKKGIRVGEHPSEIRFNRSGSLLFSSNANDNSVSIVDIREAKEIERLNTGVFPSTLAGSTPNSSTLSADEKTLFVANADNNCLAVFDISKPGNSRSLGFIPTGWYPTQVIRAGNNLYVANGKGLSSFANPKGPNPLQKTTVGTRHKGSKVVEQYIGGLMKGNLSIIPVPGKTALATYTRQVFANTPYRPKQNESAGTTGCGPIPCKIGTPSKQIKYVFYVIKENRTYDQVLGDIKEGNGDSTLCLFPEKITPNQHALARDFALLDNFYVDAEVSADGHNWSMAAYANDFVEKTWPTSYGGRGGNYDFEGTRHIAFPSQGFIWDHAAREHISYRTYGEFAEYGKATIPALEGHFCKPYPGFDLSIPDSAKERIWERDFDSLLAIGKLPQLSTIRLANDHTAGQSRGEPTVISFLADNDQGVGQLVEHISHSSVWKECMIFILEDDAQGGSDHVDAHRSPAYVVGPFVKRHFVDHTPYSTSGMLRSMELILGMKPMSQYDASATPFFNLTTGIPDVKPFDLLKARVSTHEINTVWNRSMERSGHMDFSREDRAPDAELNEVIWKAVRSENSSMPSPRHSAFVMAQKKVEKD